MKRTFFAIAAVLLIALPSFAQSVTGEISAASFSHDALQLTPSAPSTTSTIVVDSTPSFSITVLAASRTLSVTLVGPNGVSYHGGDQGVVGFQSAILPIDGTATTPAGASYLLTINNPIAGNWRLQVSESATLAAPLDLLVNTFLNNRVRLALAGGGDTFPLGRDVRLALVAFDGNAKITGVTVDAKVFRPFDPAFTPQTVTFRDDGIGADETAGDGIFEAFVNPGQAGNYQVQVDAGGRASTGVFHRSAATTLRIVNQDAIITGFADEAIDDNSDGLYDRVAVVASATINVAADYMVTVKLRGSNGREIQKSMRQSFGVGGGSAYVNFAGADISRDLAVDGPYAVTEIRYSEVMPDEVVPVDVRFDLGDTTAYLLAQLQHKRLRLDGTGSATGVDFNGNGRFDRLDVGVGVIADFGGYYSFSCSLKDSKGHELGFRNGYSYFNPGSNTLNLSFAGLPIGQNGVDGPYVVSDLILYGAGQSLIATTAFTTPAFAASKFEGFTLDTTPPVVTVSVTPSVLWPANHQLVEIAVKVVAIDNLDPDPVVRLMSITSSQAPNDIGDGNTANDIVVTTDGRILLRAERTGTKKDDRVYTIRYQATDASGNVGTGSANVTVPHDQAGK